MPQSYSEVPILTSNGNVIKSMVQSCFSLLFSFLLMTELGSQSFKTIVHALWDFATQCRALALVPNIEAKILDPARVMSTTTFSPSEPV